MSRKDDNSAMTDLKTWYKDFEMKAKNGKLVLQKAKGSIQHLVNLMQNLSQLIYVP